MTVSGSYIIHIRSKDCENITTGYNTNLRVNLSAPILRLPDERMRISLSSAEIPHTWYNLSDELSSVSLWVDSAVSLELPEGNYDIYELTEAITADATFPFSATYNSITGKVTLENTDGGSGHTINFTQTNSLGLARALGFDADVTVAIGGTAVATGVVNLVTLHSLFIYSSLSVANVITTKQGGFESILDQIPIKTRPYEVIHYTPYDTAPFSATLSDDYIKTFEIALKDQNGNLVQLNGARFEIAILVELHDHDGHQGERPTKQRRTEEIPSYQAPVPLSSLQQDAFTGITPFTPSTNVGREPVQLTPTQPTQPTIVPPVANAPADAGNGTQLAQPVAQVDPVANPVADEQLDDDLDSAILMAHSLDQN